MQSGKTQMFFSLITQKYEASPKKEEYAIEKVMAS